MRGMQFSVHSPEGAMARIDGLPARWQKRLMGRWHRLKGASEFTGTYDANTFIRTTVELLEKVRIPLDATDTEICDRAMALALRCCQLATLYHDARTLRSAMDRVAEGQGVEPPSRKIKKFKEDGPAIARMACPIWWRRKLRAHHARTLETAAIRMGYVSKREQIYCSNETLYRMQQRDKAAAAMLEKTMARNELGQEFSIQELKEKSVSNKAIRRAELMTRISGFEHVARAAGHAGLFLTITCPSRMHAKRTFKHGRVIVDNPKYDGTTPREAQQYLASRVWAPMRAKLARKGIKLYGFRIAEPQHDGTPHWHLLVFCEPLAVAVVKEVLLDYGLRDSGDEAGARANRVDFKPIDWSKGTAAGYIAKYVAKNIDGYRLEHDLYGTPALEASARVEMWARTWRIRQFQQVGGPPVTIWRELRRIEELPKGAPAHLVKAHNAVNKVAVIEGKECASVAWHHYCEAQGGVFCGRLYSIRLDMQEQEGLNRYGEEKAARTVGVYTSGIEEWTPPWMAHMPGALIPRRVEWFVESSRHVWEIVGRDGNERRGIVDFGSSGAGNGRSVGCVNVVCGDGGMSALRAPWTCVNNCTEVEKDGAAGANEGSAGGMEQSPCAHQIDGWEVHGAAVDRARVALPTLPFGGWRENDADYLQGYELQPWKRRHLHGPWERKQ